LLKKVKKSKKKGPVDALWSRVLLGFRTRVQELGYVHLRVVLFACCVSGVETENVE
jgi:hypothetical protein